VRADLPQAPWLPDELLGAPFEAETIPLDPDEEGAAEATLVRLAAPQPTRKAVLYVHGFNDYFFQVEWAQWWVDRGYDFYAVDLRKYGRSLRPHMTPCYVSDLELYFVDLDEAYARITTRDGHDSVVVAAHSTGGLILPLWLASRTPDEVTGLVLNSPWLDMHGPFWMRVGSNVMRQVGGYQPKREIPRGAAGFYGPSLHKDFDGEWNYELALKPNESRPIYAGWLRAVRLGQARLQSGLDLPYPTLVLTSGSTTRPTEMGEDVFGHDIVLDVEHMRRWSPQIARHVTLAPIEGAMHDVILSRPSVRARAYDELGRWHEAYVAR
jgi:alpha-beta hydrolase superfamily lysophospholipase